ncbi:hypothetical protein ABQE21_10305 [Enterococcus casseliflavus]|uniref:hypothetical protein n=1 Tax=Enterococcus TaxID=1350 RepID=UPI000A34BEB0|nr:MULTISPECIES: hypothetical protein [Enterococcus]MBO0426793.1 hypothetical protein [Enterococcus faecium]MBW9322253.1 hypothetical protein [Enterococcus casseliflavus]MBZ0323347.1 hypothetical protein [Enterococcus casseliflavus]MDC0750800.1 hypothetical protein [Enterococcus innesii]MDC0775114.1 hypothetical protein [Enterococcus innesii]
MSTVANYLDVKRKHFRFPAYDDTDGVKLQSEHRPAFSKADDWILTEIKDTVSHSHKEENQSLQRKVQSSQRDRGHNVRQKEELANHRANLPQYGKRPVKEQMPTGKTNFFGKDAKHSSYQVTSKQERAEVASSPKKEYSGRSYFVPKYIPASIIPDEQKPEITSDDLMDAMAKKQESYLLFDNEPAAYQVKEENDPTVKKFNRPQSVGMTRSEFRANNKKNSDKKRSVLDRSLQGMIEDDQREDSANGYFRSE